MLNRHLARLAFRTRAASLVVATTGAVDIEATATGYRRATGSFAEDGFVVGQDVTPSGFPQADVGVIGKGLTATVMPIVGGRTVAATASGRSLVSGLPTLRAWQNVNFGLITGRPYVVEALPFGGSRGRHWPNDSASLVQEGLSVWTWYAPAGDGAGALDVGVSALMALFAPGTRLTLADGTVIRMRGDIGPTAGDVVDEGGFARVTVTLPWRTHTRNTVLA